jgi:TP901 family phage tail tape measure protein
MAIYASQLIGNVSITGVERSVADLLRVGAATDSTGGKLAGLAVGATVLAGAAIVGLGAKSVKMAADFQTQTNMFVTSAGELSSNLDIVRSGILKMAVDTATSTKQLNDGMYMVESAGYHGAAGLKVLQAAAEGAKAENADLSTVTNAVTSALNAYHLGANSAIPVTNDLVAAVGAGKMHMQDLAGALKNVLPAAAAAGISLSDVTAAIATMTAQGDPAASAATHLRQVILALEAPAKAGASALKNIGLTTQEVTDEMRKSLPDTLQMITDALGKKFPEGSAAYNAALKDIAGGNKQLLGMLELTGSHLQTYKDDVAQVTNAVQKGGDAVYGFSVVQDSFNFKLQKAGEVAETLGIKIGTVLLPVLGPVLDNVTSLITRFGDWATSTQGLMGYINQLTAFVSYLYQDVQSNGALKEFGSILGDIGQVVGNTVNTALQILGTLFGTTATQAGKASDAATNVANGFKRVLDTIKPLTDAASWLSSQFADAGVKGQILRDALITIGGAIAGIKIAEFAPGIIRAMTDAGVATKGFGLQLAGLQTQAATTATSVAGVGTAASGTAAAETEAATSAGSLKTSFIGLGTAMGPIIGIATAVTLALDKIPTPAYMAQVGIDNVRKAFDSVQLGGVVQRVQQGSQAIQENLAKMEKAARSTFDNMYQNATNDTTRLQTGVTLAFNTMRNGATENAQSMDAYVKQRMADMQQSSTNSADIMGKSVSGKIYDLGNSGTHYIDNMKANIVNDFFNMHKQVYSETQALTSQALADFQQLNGDLTSQMASTDANVIGYWNDIANYINNNPINGYVNINVGGNYSGSSATVHHYAEGTSYAPGGPSWVGERGPELMYVPRGAQIVPHNQSVGMASGGGGSAQPIHIHVHMGTHEVGRAILPDLVTTIRNATGAKF